MDYIDNMITRRVAIGGAAGFLAQLMAQNAPSVRTVFQHELPDVTLQHWSVTAVEVSYGPGESSTAHRHPGITIAYVLEGEIRSKVGNEPERNYTPGQIFLETPGQLHAVSRNGSTTKPAKLLAILLAETGKPLTTREPGQ